MSAALHVTNGDSAVARLRAAGIDGEIIAWRDVLHDGPVPPVGWTELRAERARFIASRGWGAIDDVLADFTARDDALMSALGDGRAVTLWFEHDLYDQLQLIQVLVMCADAIRDGAPVWLAQADDYLGHAEPLAIRRLASRVVRVGEGELREAEAAWMAFTAPTADALHRIAEGRDRDAADDRAGDALRYLRPALQRLLEELPNPVTGLTRTELQTLRALAHAPRSMREAYAAAHHDAESPIWLGDSSFEAIVGDLAAEPHPLVRTRDGMLQLTPDGDDVLHGRAHRGTLQPVDRWVGGIHMTG